MHARHLGLWLLLALLCGFTTTRPAQATLVTGFYTALAVDFSGDVPLVPLDLPLTGSFTYEAPQAGSLRIAQSLTGTVDDVTMRFTDLPLGVHGCPGCDSFFRIGPGGTPDLSNPFPDEFLFIELFGIGGPLTSDDLPTTSFDPNAFSDPHVHFLNVRYRMTELTIGTAVPEPGSLALMLGALVMWATVCRRARR